MALGEGEEEEGEPRPSNGKARGQQSPSRLRLRNPDFDLEQQPSRQGDPDDYEDEGEPDSDNNALAAELRAFKLDSGPRLIGEHSVGEVRALVLLLHRKAHTADNPTAYARSLVKKLIKGELDFSEVGHPSVLGALSEEDWQERLKSNRRRSRTRSKRVIITSGAAVDEANKKLDAVGDELLEEAEREPKPSSTFLGGEDENDWSRCGRNSNGDFNGKKFKAQKKAFRMQMAQEERDREELHKERRLPRHFGGDPNDRLRDRLKPRPEESAEGIF